MSNISEWIRKLGHRLCKPNVPEKLLFPQCVSTLEAGDARLFKKLVQKGRLAPFYPGSDEPQPSADMVECPICCMYYSVMNKTRCCAQRICSECIVRIRVGCQFASYTCPFCKRNGLEVEISTGRTDGEKREDLIEEQRFRECRIRQIVEADSEATPQTDAEPPHATATTTPDTSAEPGPPLPLTPLESANLGILLESSARPVLPPTPSSIQEEYQQEYEALSRRTTLSVNLSNSDIVQCEEYLGVSPEDLGLRLEEFNDLLLEQTLISSMMEMRKAEKRREMEEATERVTSSDPGASSSSSVAERRRGIDGEESPVLRSHCLPLPHPVVHEDDDHSNGDEESRWSLDNVLRQVLNRSSSQLLSSLGVGETSAAVAEDVSTDEVSSSEHATTTTANTTPTTTTEESRKEEDDEFEFDPEPSPVDDSGSSGSSDQVGEGWKGLINSLTGFHDLHAHFRMIRVKFDDPEIDKIYNPPPPPQIFAEGSSANNIATVENPDGSIAIVSLPPPPPEPVSEDQSIKSETDAADRSQIEAIEAADRRLRQLFQS